MEKYTKFTSRVAVIPVNDIDTDQIIPARFLKVTDKAGLGANVFCNWRFQADGSENREFILNQTDYKTAQVLLAGNNFGCGSSREHAPWALMGFGFRAVISTTFADIFRNNSLKNGLLPIQVSAEAHQELMSYFSGHPERRITVDLEKQQILLDDGRSFGFPMDDFSKTCLLNGIDELGYLLNLDREITAYEQTV
jgi:3-isopropylmalate/(R)-2-methylmalate dehydratase small subunit